MSRPDWVTGRHRCPACGREREAGSRGTFGVTVEGGRGVGHCFRCGHVETWNAGGRESRPGKAPAQPVAAPKRETLSDHGHGLWNACRALSGEALAYLECRRCMVPPADGHLRWHPALKHPVAGTELPALVALVTDAVTGRPLTLHRTWIQADGRKAAVNPPRMLLGGHRKAGGVIRLWPDEAVTTGLGIAEGIESALSLAWGYRPVWAAIDAGNLAALPALPSIKVLLIGADNDPAGMSAAQDCADRWIDAGAEVFLVEAPAGGDLNDLARRGPLHA